MTTEQQLIGWEFDVTALKGEGAFLSPPKVPRAFSTKVIAKDSPTDILKEEEWCSYGGMPSPMAYMNE